MKCTNCKYEGEKIVDNLFCPVCGDYMEGKKPGSQSNHIPKESNPVKKVEAKKEEPEVSLDLNNDGKIDEKDATIAGKVLRHTRKIRKRKKKVN